MGILCHLEFSEDGNLATLRHAKNDLPIARFKVFGPMRRIAEGVQRAHDAGPFQAVAQGISDWEYIDDRGDVRTVGGRVRSGR